MRRVHIKNVDSNFLRKELRFWQFRHIWPGKENSGAIRIHCDVDSCQHTDKIAGALEFNFF